MERRACEIEEDTFSEHYSNISAGDFSDYQDDVMRNSDESNYGDQNQSDGQENLLYDDDINDNYEYDDDFLPEEARFIRKNHIRACNDYYNNLNEINGGSDPYDSSLRRQSHHSHKSSNYMNFSYCKVISVSLLLLLLQHTGRVVYLCGFHRTVFDHSPGPCKEIKEIAGGSADIITLKTGLSFISSGYAPHLSDCGRIYTFDHIKQSVKELTFSDDFDKYHFWPHGLSAWQNPTSGDIVLFVINHHPIGDRIEKFEYDKENGHLKHMDTILDANIKKGSSIVALDSERFYFSNIGYNSDKNLLFLEVFFMMSWGNIVYYDGDKTHVVSRGFLPNGLAMSPNQEILYVASTGTEDIRVFRSNKHDGSLQFVNAMSIEAGLENINVDPETGDLYVGAFNAIAEYIQHDNNPIMPCGSRVFRIKPAADGVKLDSLSEIYASSGGLGLACATAATFYNGSLLIGAVRSSPLVCQVLYE